MGSEEFFKRMTPPVKIALLGAPGAGKSVVAKKIAARLNRDSRAAWMEVSRDATSVIPSKWWTIVDDYVPKLSARTGRTFGEIYDRSAFPLNLQVVAERWTSEDVETTKGINTITCGTVYESIIYSAAQSMPIAHLSDEQLMMEETYIAKMMVEGLRTSAAVRFDYDILFYLPLEESKKGHDWATVVDDKLSEVLAGQNLTAIVLDGTYKRQVKRGIEIIQEYTAALADDERSAIRQRDATSEEQESELEQVSDVPADEATDSS